MGSNNRFRKIHEGILSLAYDPLMDKRAKQLLSLLQIRFMVFLQK